MALEYSVNYEIQDFSLFLESVQKKYEDSKDMWQVERAISILFGECTVVNGLLKIDHDGIIALAQGCKIEFYPIAYQSMRNSVKAFKDLHKSIKNRPEIAEKISEIVIEKKLKYSIIGDSWVICLISKQVDDISLEDYISCVCKGEISLELIVVIMIQGVRLAEQFNECGSELKHLSLRDIFLRKEGNGGHKVYFDVYNRDFLRKSAIFSDNLTENLSSIQLFFRNLSAILFSCASGIKINIYQDLKQKITSLTKHYTFGSRFISGLTAIVTDLYFCRYKSIKNLINLTDFITWESYFKEFNGDTAFSSSVLYSGFNFTTLDLRLKALRQLEDKLEYINEFSQIYKNFNEHKRILKFFVNVPIDNNKTARFILLFLKQLKILDADGELPQMYIMIHKIFKYNFDLTDASIRKDLIDSIKIFCKKKTITYFKIIEDTNILLRLTSLYSEESAVLIQFFPHLGISAFKAIKGLYKHNLIKYPAHPISLIQQIPIHIRLQNTLRIIKFIDRCFEAENHKIEIPSSSTIMGFNIIFDALKAAKEAKESNRLGNCYKNPYNFNITPIMIYCKKCEKTLCVPCGRFHEDSTHSIIYRTHYTLKKSICEEDDRNMLFVHESQHIFPRYYLFDIAIKNIGRDRYAISSGELNLTFGDVPDVIFYTEFFFSMIYTDDFELELEGSGVVFKNLAGMCMKNDTFVTKMPKYGANDTLGLGITNDKAVFFTYNGFHLNHLIKFSLTCISISLIFSNCSNPPIVTQPEKSLYIGEELISLERYMICDYKHIIWSYIAAYKAVKPLGFQHHNTILDVVHEIRQLFDKEFLIKTFGKKYQKIIKDCSVI